MIVGPNACGKSTTLRALGRLLKPKGGAVLLDGRALAELPTRRIAQQIGLLPQTPSPRRRSPSATWSPADASPTSGGGGSGRTTTSGR